MFEIDRPEVVRGGCGREAALCSSKMLKRIDGWRMFGGVALFAEIECRRRSRAADVLALDSRREIQPPPL
ncbi:hypothetical protein ACFQU1_13600 [Chelatococcus sp. GCM10030263]|uniref:hypothetical protein n=1 Tax=Chelatococcus sp. GCM10030263 TaxID=3273387 RepID=UPI00361BCB8B